MSHAAIRGWAYCIEHALYDWRGKMPDAEPHRRRVLAAQDAGLVQVSGLGLHYWLTEAGIALFAEYEQRRPAPTAPAAPPPEPPPGTDPELLPTSQDEP